MPCWSLVRSTLKRRHEPDRCAGVPATAWRAPGTSGLSVECRRNSVLSRLHRMLRVARMIVMWFIAAALPLQGIAAVSMSVCGAPVNSQSTTRSAQASEAMAMGHHHHEMAQSSTDGAKGFHHGNGEKSSTKCSVCASCCTSAVLTAVLVLPAPVAQTYFYVSLDKPGAITFLTTGQERPPRFFPA